MTDHNFDPAHPSLVLREGAAAVNELRQHIDKCVEFVGWISQYTNVVKGVPSSAQYMATYTAMREPVTHMQQLKLFADDLANKFGEGVGQLPKLGKDSADFHRVVNVMARVLDMCAVLNYLKMFNAALMNDFSMFKRSFQQVRGDLGSDEADEVAQQSNVLHFFLANPNAIVDGVRTATQLVPGYEASMELFMAELARAAMVKDVEVLPQEKNALVRALVYAVFVTDGGSCNAFKLPSVRQARPVLKHNPEVAVHGQLWLTCLVVLQSCPHWERANEKEWVGGDDAMPCVCL